MSAARAGSRKDTLATGCPADLLRGGNATQRSNASLYANLGNLKRRIRLASASSSNEMLSMRIMLKACLRSVDLPNRDLKNQAGDDGSAQYSR